jgi:hypothetical protein
MAAGTDAMPSNPAFIKRDLGRFKPPSGGFLFRWFLNFAFNRLCYAFSEAVFGALHAG